MAFPDSHVNGRTMRDHMVGNISLDLNSDTIKVALFTNAVTGSNPNNSESYGSGPWGSNEVSSVNYTAGGLAVNNPSIANPSGGKFSLRVAEVGLVWEDVTFVARGALIYDASVSNRVLAAINFGEDKEVVGGDFTLNWDPDSYIMSWVF